MNSYWILEDIKGSNIKIIRIIHSRRFDIKPSSTSPRLLPSVVCKDWYFWASGWAIIIQFITRSRKVCLLLLLLIFEQRDRPFWAVCHFLVLSGFRVVIWIDAWERIRSARDVLPRLPGGQCTTWQHPHPHGLLYQQLDWFQCLFLSESFWRYQQWFHCQP